MQTVVVGGKPIQVASYDELTEYFRKEKVPNVVTDADNVWGTIVTKTHSIKAIHRNCQKEYGECACESQAVRGAYRISIASVSTTHGQRRLELRALLKEWVVPISQLAGITARDIKVHLQPYRYKVYYAVQALSRAG